MYITLRAVQSSKRLAFNSLLRRSFSSKMLASNPEEVLSYWFGPDHVQWFGGGEKADKDVREKCSGLVQDAFDGKLDSWKEEPRSSLALILICDQLCRSVHKGTAKMYGLDPVSLALAHKFVEQKGAHNHLDFNLSERSFIYMPLEHNESREDHILCESLFEKLVEDAKTPEEKKFYQGFLSFTKIHKEVIDMFGRYPQRNAILGRPDTPEEAEFLANMPAKYKW